MSRHNLGKAARPLVLAAAAAMAGCGGGGGGAAPTVTATVAPVPTPAPGGSGTLSFQIAVPAGNSASLARSPKYVSPNTASVTVTLQGQTTPLVTANVSSTAPGCSVTTGGYVCTVTFSAPAGTDTLQVATYNGSNGSGSQLSVATLVQSVTANATTKVPLALSGVVATVAVILGTTSVPAGTPASVAVTVAAYDSSGNMIVGPGSFSSPVTLTDSDTTGVTTLSASSVAGPGTSVTLNYSGNSLVGATITPFIGGTAGTAATFAPTGYAVADYNLPSSDTNSNDYDAITAGPDGNVWYGTYGIIGKVTPQGQFTEYTSSTTNIPSTDMYGLAAGPDGNVWFVAGETIGKITPGGAATVVTTYNWPGSPGNTSTCGQPYAIVKGGDGNLWFDDYDCGYIGMVNPTTMVATEWDITQLPGSPPASSGPYEMTIGADGKLYLGEYAEYGLDQITISNGVPTQVTFVQMLSDCYPYGIAAGPDGNIWFSDDCENVGAVSPTNFTASGMAMWSIAGVADDEDFDYMASSPGGVWATDDESNVVYRITNVSGVSGDSYFSLTPTTPTQSQPPAITPVQAFAYAYSEPYAIALGADGNIWTVMDDETPNAIAKVIYGAPGAGATSVSAATRSARTTQTRSVLKLGPMSRTHHPSRLHPQAQKRARAK